MHCMHTRVQPSCVVQACSWCTHRLAHCCTFDTRFVHNISHMDVLLVQAQQCATHARACICTHLLCIRCTLTTTSLVQTFARAPFCTLRLHLHALHVHTGAWLCSLCVHTLARSPVHTCGCKPAAQAPRAPLHNPCFALLGAALGRTLTFACVMRASLEGAHVLPVCARFCTRTCEHTHLQQLCTLVSCQLVLHARLHGRHHVHTLLLHDGGGAFALTRGTALWCPRCTRVCKQQPASASSAELPSANLKSSVQRAGREWGCARPCLCLSSLCTRRW